MINQETVEIEAALRRFFAAFENCDLTQMEAMLDPDCVSFPQAVEGRSRLSYVELDGFRRSAGMPPDMGRIVQAMPKGVSGPPYHSIRPTDLLIQVFGDAAIATFHLEHEGSLGRRTIVLAKRGGDWRIVHIHPSGVESSHARA
jgi:ketosteroid isomerase-like protein